MSDSARIRLEKSFEILFGKTTRILVTVAFLALLICVPTAQAFWASLSASPDPNTGDFTVSWSNPTSLTYTLQEMPAGGSYTSVTATNGSSHQFTGKAAGTYTYRLMRSYLQCSGWPEPECYRVTTYSETITVTVNEPPSGGPDPFPPPGAFSPPDATAFPDQALVNPADPGGDDLLNSVGAVNGSGGVSGGQAGYSIPIVVPPGRKGMQPAISLNYSSSSGNGIAGVGWGLSAGGAISRCSASPAQDETVVGSNNGFTASPQYDAQRDRLCLNGQRLVAETGYTYGTSGARYRTELDQFARVTQTGLLNGSSTSFLVEYKDGRRSWFGTTTDSRHVASGRTEVLSWALSETRDRSGNTITYDYTSYGDGEYHLDAIHYTGYNGSDGDRHVEFDYELRPDTRTIYLAGGKTRSTQRLTKVSTKYQTTTIREYTLTYGAVSLSSDRSLLRSVEECAYQSGSKHCLPETDFEWQEKAPEYKVEQLQFFDGNTAVDVHEDKRWLHDVIPHGDANGDGVKDWTDWYINAEGQKTGDPSTSLANCYRQLLSFTLTCMEADFNADGLTDSFRQNNNKLEVRMAGSSTWIVTNVEWEHRLLSALDDNPLGFADFNGDGWTDLAVVQLAKLYVYFHTKNVAAPYSTSNRQWLMDIGLSSGSTSQTQAVSIQGDMDGNGTPDFLVSRHALPNEPQGTPRPEYIILTKSQAGGTMSTSTRTITGLLEGLTANSHFFHDVNGDGLQDLLGIDELNNYKVAYRINTGSDFDSTWRDLGFSLPLRRGRYLKPGDEWEAYRYPIMSMVFAMDYNSDGRDELMVADTSPNSIVASGCGLVNEVLPDWSVVQSWLCDDEMYDEYIANSNTYVGTPINSEVKDNSIREYLQISFSDDASGNITATSSSSDIIASAAQTAVLDVTGDGLPDVVTVFGCRLPEPAGCLFNDQTSSLGGTVNTTYEQEGAWVNRNLGTATDIPVPTNYEYEYAPHDMMSAAEDGFGNRHEWTYKPLSSDAYDTASSEYYHTDHFYIDNNTDYFHFASSMYVVADHRASNGIGGLNSTKYRYRGAIFNNKGHGFQGFRAIEVEEDVFDNNGPDAGLDKISRTEFHQIWPESSIVETSCTWLATDTISVSGTTGSSYPDDSNPWCADVENSTMLLAKSETTLIHNVATTGGARFVAADTQAQSSYDLATRSLLTTQTVDRSFDSAGNVTAETSGHVDSWVTTSTTATSTFTLDWSNWWLDRITSQKVSHSPVTNRHSSTPDVAPGTDNLKEKTTSYLSYNTAQRLPTSLKITGNDTTLWSQVETVFNSYGLPTSITTSGTDVDIDRVVTTAYSKDGLSQSADGYFVYTVQNGLGHETEQHTDPKHGQPVSQWDVNNLLAVTTYDAFGRTASVRPPGGPTSYTYFFWCDGYPTCPTGAKYSVRTLRAGAPEANVYLDQLGRELKSSVKRYDNVSDINVVTTFDVRGNVTFKSQPHDLNAGEMANVGTDFLGYDALGRLTGKSQDQANGQALTTSYSYQGLQTNVLAGTISMHRVYNGLGQLMETRDGLNGYTRYAFDGAGNPIVMQDPAMAQVAAPPTGRDAAIVASFNALGFKEWVEDPDWWDDTNSTYGRRLFEYSGLGEVLLETDPNGNEIVMEYDRLGRMIERWVNDELEGLWVFDNTDTHKGLGLLDYEDSQFRSDGSRLQKFYYYSGVATGRKNLLQVTHRFYEGDDQYDYQEYNTAYFTDGNYGRPKGLQYPGGISLAYLYNSNGFLVEENDPVNNITYRESLTFDSRGQIKTADVAKHGSSFQYAVINEFYAATGHAKAVTVSNGAPSFVDLDYTYDLYGNLATRSTSHGVGNVEMLGYDALQRLTSSSRTYNPNKPLSVSYTFDGSGSLKSKSDYASLYSYNLSRPHVVDQVTLSGGGTVSFSHDENGNMTAGHGENITYTAFNKPEQIDAQVGTNWARFQYGSDLMRYRQEKQSGALIYYVDKLMEIELLGTAKDYRHYIGDVAIVTKTGSINDPTPGYRYTFRDRLGSIAAMADQSGYLSEYRGFDAYGKPRNGDWTDKSPAIINSTVTDRGFTDHEHLDDWQLIHMNGRGYDYNLGRFISIDPFIGDPGNSQAINPYSYILSNPLSGTDPSGYMSCNKTGSSCSRKSVVRDSRSVNKLGERVTQTVTKNESGSISISETVNGVSTVQTISPTNDQSIDDIQSPGQVAKATDVGGGANGASSPQGEGTRAQMSPEEEATCALQNCHGIDVNSIKHSTPSQNEALSSVALNGFGTYVSGKACFATGQGCIMAVYLAVETGRDLTEFATGEDPYVMTLIRLGAAPNTAQTTVDGIDTVADTFFLMNFYKSGVRRIGEGQITSITDLSGLTRAGVPAGRPILRALETAADVVDNSSTAVDLVTEDQQ